MPIYEYACGKCEHEFEVEQRITDDPIKTCPKCRSRKVKKLISQTSFLLKGGGWYSDLYSSSKPKDSKSDSADGGSKSDSSSDTKSDSKGESKGDKKSSGGDSKSKGKGKGSPKAAA